jgi:UDP-2,3-diacylglucosamine hydrolase
MIEPALELTRGPLYLISDAHLGSAEGPPEREAWLLDLLARIRREAAGLFVVGDLFDFWFEYRHAIPKVTFRIARALADFVDSGVPVIYMGGNHDFWVGPWLQRELGIRSFDDPIHARLQGRLVYLAHGDGLGPGDTGYKLLKKILRHPRAISAYRGLHPDLGIPFAAFASHLSRSKNKLPPEVLLPRVVRDIVRPALSQGASAMIMGHLHRTAHYQEEGPDGMRDFLLLGDWIELFTYARMEEGLFTLCRRTGDGGEATIAPEPFPPNPVR